jgi:transposase
LQYISRFVGLPISTSSYYFNKKKIDPNWEPSRKGRKSKPRQLYLPEVERFAHSKKYSVIRVRDLKVFLDQRFVKKANYFNNTFCRHLLRACGYVYKRSHPGYYDRNSEYVKTRRRIFAQTLLALMKAKNTAIFIDETSFNSHAIPFYSYAKRRQTLRFTVPKSLFKCTVIAAATNKELIGYQIYKGSVNALRFGYFLLSLIEYVNYHGGDLNKIWFFLDNAPIHRAALLKSLYNHVNIQYLAPYSPETNPIEEVFSYWKRRFRQASYNNQHSFLRGITCSAKSLQSRCFSIAYLHTLNSLRQCLLLEDID